MTNGVVDFNFGGFGESSDFVPPALMAPLETFSLNGRTEENQRLFSVGDLGLKNLNTTFKDDALEEHLMASTLEDSDPWILFDSGTLEDFKKALLEQLSEKDPATGQPYTHDLWLDFPSCWVRVHYESRNTLFVPEDAHFEEQLGNGRMTLVVRPDADAAPFWHADVWRKTGATLVSEPFVGATCFEKADLQLVDVEPEAPEYVAHRPKGLKQPGEPTLTERLEHELTHLPFKPWCEVCVRAKSKQAKSRRLSLKQPVLQMDFSFLGDKPGGEQITILNVVDVLTNMALSVVIPTKARTPYSQAELRRFVLETGRTFGVLQCDPEPALRAIATSVTGEVGGLSFRSTPVGWKQAQGTVGNMQATLYGQIKALRLEILERYDVDLSVHSALFTWLVRHAQWLVNRYLCNAEGTTAFERRWRKKYAGFLCRFGETVLFRKPHTLKGRAAFVPGIWLGKDTESDQHFVADASGVFKTRSVKRHPPSRQADVALLQSISARPWDPTGSKAETDTFVFPAKRSEEATALDPSNFGEEQQQQQASEPLAPSDLQEVEQLLEDDFDDAAAEAIPPRDNLSDWESMSEGDNFEPPSVTLDQQVQGQTRSSSEAALPEPLANRPRLEEASASPTKRSSETLPVGTSKVQRMASVTFARTPKRFRVCDFRISAVTTKQDLEVPVAVNQDEKELLLMKTLENPHIWYNTEFPHEEEAAGMTKEMKSMRDFGVFDEVDIDKVPREALESAISTKWVKLRKPDGTVRCRIVARGYTQQVEDKDETFASTPSLTTLRLLLTLAVAKGWHISIGDISTAFLHALVNEDFYVIPPLEFYPEGRTLWKLRKALYGLKHSPKLWQQHFASVMEKNNFRRMKSDPNLYVHESKKLYVLAYVDDLMFFGSCADVSTLIADLQKDLLLKVTGTLDEGNSATFLGRNLKRTSTFISVGMSPSYIDAMLELYGLTQCRHALAPGSDALRKNFDVEPLEPEDHKRYRRAVGQLLWLSSVRPDIMYAVKELSRGLSAPTSEHEAKVKHLLKYLAGTKNFEQKLQPTLSLSPQHKAIDINIYVDSDWAGCHDTRMVRIRKVLGTLNPTDILTKYIAKVCDFSGDDDFPVQRTTLLVNNFDLPAADAYFGLSFWLRYYPFQRETFLQELLLNELENLTFVRQLLRDIALAKICDFASADDLLVLHLAETLCALDEARTLRRLKYLSVWRTLAVRTVVDPGPTLAGNPTLGDFANAARLAATFLVASPSTRFLECPALWETTWRSPIHIGGTRCLANFCNITRDLDYDEATLHRPHFGDFATLHFTVP
ncbi:Retrovirus-related Pol polyprotein from transposon TNT 1-94 [Symbiodinium microadriaticum]|uniref:Retrovirus-related Pol polyprotein from transposon TNT 1-94 n=1 Tax=Symbiodinium microadriaticum TaxID=2951 RepID=A0A1Q9DQM7_SYMMI|nr:Retrovirus-related Pol polyprotein from transposon TNT 1-94 [Symbiodinium microadriaticum]